MRLTQYRLLSGDGVSGQQEGAHGQRESALRALEAVRVQHDVELETDSLGRVNLLLAAHTEAAKWRLQLAHCTCSVWRMSIAQTK